MIKITPNGGSKKAKILPKPSTKISVNARKHLMENQYA
jgi:hypothetical protein